MDSSPKSRVSKILSGVPRWYLATFLAILSPELAFVYLGWALKNVLRFTIIFGLLQILFLAVPGYVLGFPEEIKVVSALNVLLYLGAFLWVILVAIKARRATGVYRPPATRYLWVFLLLLSIDGLSLFLENHVGVFASRTFKVPTGSMIPTILPGDYVRADTTAYEEETPQVGDIVVFESHGTTYVKRVIAVGSQSVFLNKRQLFIDGLRAPRREVEDAEVEADLHGQADYTIFEETLPQSRSRHLILLQNQEVYDLLKTSNYPSTRKPIMVPSGDLFLLGDNRDNSVDSRVYGFIDESQVVGKVNGIFMSLDSTDRVFRWHRFFKHLN